MPAIDKRCPSRLVRERHLILGDGASGIRHGCVKTVHIYRVRLKCLPCDLESDTLASLIASDSGHRHGSGSHRFIIGVGYRVVSSVDQIRLAAFYHKKIISVCRRGTAVPRAPRIYLIIFLAIAIAGRQRHGIAVMIRSALLVLTQSDRCVLDQGCLGIHINSPPYNTRIIPLPRYGEHKSSAVFFRYGRNPFIILTACRTPAAHCPVIVCSIICFHRTQCHRIIRSRLHSLLVF